MTRSRCLSFVASLYSRGWSAGLSMLFACISVPALCYTPDYSGLRDADLLHCDQQQWRGEQVAAQSCWQQLLNTSERALIQAEAYWALGDLKTANTRFNQATQEEPENPLVKTRWAYLYLETYQDQEAMGLLQEALAIQGDFAPARVGVAAAMTTRFGAGGIGELYNILEDNPDNIRALLILAKLSLEYRDVGGAEPYLDWADDLVSAQLPSYEITSYRAVAAYISGEDPEPWITRALAENPSSAEVFVDLAYFADLTFQYIEAVNFLQRGVQIEPNNWIAQAQLGTNLTRLNRIDEARGHLQTAYRGDPYNHETVNMLRLMDNFGEFVSNVHHVEYQFQGRPHTAEVVLKLHRDERAFLEPYATQLVERAIPIYAQRYNFAPSEPIVIEIYPNHDDFAVRTVGTPGVGLLGVAFGYLFAMDSPSGRPPGEFHWGTTLWHELAHVFTLKASNSRLPRWYSEGLSVFEEWHSGPVPGRQIPSYVLQAFSEERMLPIAELDFGFMRPTYENQIVVSYMQAGLVCTYIAETWGDTALADMLDAFTQRQNTRQAIEAVTGLPDLVFDREFQTWVRAQMPNVFSDFERWAELQATASDLYAAEDWQGLIDATQASIELIPTYVEPNSAYILQAQAYRKLEDTTQERATLTAYVAQGGSNPSALTRLVELYLQNDQTQDALHTYEAFMLVAPQQREPHRLLADLYLVESQPENARREFEILLGMGELDTAALHLGIAKSYQQQNNLAAAKRSVLRSLEAAPFYREAQQLLTQLVNQENP